MIGFVFFACTNAAMFVSEGGGGGEGGGGRGSLDTAGRPRRVVGG